MADHSLSCLHCISIQCWTLSSREVPSQSLEKAVSSISLAQEVIWVVCCSAGPIHHTAHALLSQSDGTEMCCSRINSFCAVWLLQDLLPHSVTLLARVSQDPLHLQVVGLRDRSKTLCQSCKRNVMQASLSPCYCDLRVFLKHCTFISVFSARDEVVLVPHFMCERLMPRK